MARMVVIYRTPKNVEAFDRHYFEIHVPLAKKIPGLRKYEVSDGPIATPVGTSNVHLIGTLHFDFLRLMTRAFKCSFSTTGNFEPIPLCSSRRARAQNGGKMAGGRLYRS